MHNFEIEIKSLLGSKDKADELLAKMKAQDRNLQVLGSHKQLNHYFIGGNLQNLFENIQNYLASEDRLKLNNLAEKAKDFSVRTRWADGKVILVVKASVDDTTSSNGTARLEFESVIPAESGIQTIDDLDKIILNSGFSYQAKWSRERQEFVFHPHLSSLIEGEEERGSPPNVENTAIHSPPNVGGARGGINVSIDKNAGYGYLAEFEKVIEDETKASEVKEEIRKIMAELGALELAQDRLARMFDYYNQNWQDYYGTDKIFNIE